MRYWVTLIILSLVGPSAAEVKLRNLQDSLRPLVERARKSTVAVVLDGSTGSGVVVDPAGIVLTAGHVVTTDLSTGEIADEVTIVFDDGDERRARVLGVNRSYDAAMLQLVGDGPWEHSPLGDSSKIRPGEWVVATGHPSGFDALRDAPVRFGRVISKNSEFFLGSDCVIFGGDSGGPLFDLEGRVVGIHSWIGDDVQINTHAGVSGFLADWKRLQKGDRWGWLQPPPVIEEGTPILGVLFENGSGPVVLETVLTSSPAERAGLVSGDEIRRVDGKRVNGNSFRRYLRNLETGDEVVLDVQRGGNEFVVRVNLGRGSSLPFVTESAQKALQQQARELFEAFRAVTGGLGDGVVRIFDEGGQQLTFGTVWTEGRVLAKWSEVENAASRRAVLSDGRVVSLGISKVIPSYDLVVLQLPGELPLRAIEARQGAVRAGTLIAAVRPDGVPEGVGVISVQDRSLLSSARGYLGVELEPSFQNGGALVVRVTEESSAAEAGLLDGDVITRVDNREIDGFQELKTILSRAGPGQEVAITVRRQTGEVSLTAILKGNPNPEEGSDRRERMMDRMDGRGLSRVRSRFPKVMQSDITITPAECGLPAVDIDGKLVGVFIARAGRVKTYLLSIETLEKIIAEDF